MMKSNGEFSMNFQLGWLIFIFVERFWEKHFFIRFWRNKKLRFFNDFMSDLKV